MRNTTREKIIIVTSEVMSTMAVFGIICLICYISLYLRSLIHNFDSVLNFFIILLLMPTSTFGMVLYQVGITPLMILIVTVICDALASLISRKGVGTQH